MNLLAILVTLGVASVQAQDQRQYRSSESVLSAMKFEAMATAELMTQLADKNGDGALDEAELSAVMKQEPKFGSDGNKFDLAVFDTNKNGKIEPSEIVAMVKKQLLRAKPDPTQMPQATKDAEEIFKLFDKNGDGSLTSAELAKATGRTVRRANYAIAFMDTNGDGKVTPQEAAEVVIKPMWDLARLRIKLHRAFPSKVASTMENMKTILKLADKNNDGVLDAQELAQATGRSVEEAQVAIAVADRGNGQITPQEAMRAFSPELIDLLRKVVEQHSKNPIKRSLRWGRGFGRRGYGRRGYGRRGFGRRGYGYGGGFGYRGIGYGGGWRRRRWGRRWY